MVIMVVVDHDHGLGAVVIMACSVEAASDHENLPFRDRMIMESERICGERWLSRSTTAPAIRAVSNRPDASVRLRRMARWGSLPGCAAGDLGRPKLILVASVVIMVRTSL